MTAVLIIAHAPLASSLKMVARHAYPDRASIVEALDVLPDMSPERIEAEARRLLAQLGAPPALIFTDVFGATPCNIAQRLADGPNIKVIAGVSVPMLWRTLCYADQPFETLVASAVSGGLQGILQLASARPQNQAQKPGGNDQAQHYHQQ